MISPKSNTDSLIDEEDYVVVNMRFIKGTKDKMNKAKQIN